SLGLRPEHVHPESGLRADRLVLVQAGCTVRDLHGVTVPRGLTLATTGASCGQTLAGAISTGTHGSAFRVGAMPALVRGIHLVTGPGTSVWLEPTSQPAGSDALAAHLGATLVRDDAKFA